MAFGKSAVFPTYKVRIKHKKNFTNENTKEIYSCPAGDMWCTSKSHFVNTSISWSLVASSTHHYVIRLYNTLTGSRGRLLTTCHYWGFAIILGFHCHLILDCRIWFLKFCFRLLVMFMKINVNWLWVHCERYSQDNWISCIKMRFTCIRQYRKRRWFSYGSRIWETTMHCR